MRGRRAMSEETACDTISVGLQVLRDKNHRGSRERVCGESIVVRRGKSFVVLKVMRGGLSCRAWKLFVGVWRLSRHRSVREDSGKGIDALPIETSFDEMALSTCESKAELENKCLSGRQRRWGFQHGFTGFE